MLSLLDLKTKIINKDFTLTTSQALDLPMIMNQKKGQVYDYDWDNNKVWLSIWDLTFDIVEIKDVIID